MQKRRRVVRAVETTRTVLRRARELRKNMTPAERALWEAVRGHRLNGLKFRRQQPINGFIADFYCNQLQLIVEIDGSYHATPQQFERDEHRASVFGKKRLRVLRFTNDQVLNDLPAVLKSISECAGCNQ